MSTLKMEIVRSSEKFVHTYKTTRRLNLENRIPAICLTKLFKYLESVWKEFHNWWFGKNA
jgi:ribosome-associated toxin RatA of RatAB toxin-antitoxin module